MCEPNEIDPAITRLEQDLRALGWRPVEMVEPSTGTPFTRWFPPGKPIPSMYLELVAERITEQGCHEDCQFPGGCLLRRDGACAITGQWATVRVPAWANIASRKCAVCGSNHSPYSCQGQLTGQPVELHDCQRCGLMHKPGPCPNPADTPDDAEVAWGEPAAYGHLDREFISDNMDFPPNFDNGPNPLGEDY